MADSNTKQPQSGAAATGARPQTEFPCPDCGEMVREGLVRCWNCGGFLRADVEQKFQKIQSRPQQIIYSPPTEDEQSADLDAMLSGGSRESEDDEDGGFELSHSAGAPTLAKSASSDTPVAEEPAAEESAPPAEDAEAAAGEEKPAESGGDEIPHSIATGGDALMQLAAQEEMEQYKRKVERGGAVDGVKAIRDGFLIDAPKGCRIQVRDERTGEMRRITFGSSSRVRISLLDKLEAIQKAEAARQKDAPTGPRHLSAGKYQRWMSDLHLHTLNPETLKLKADSMAKEFVPVEVGFANDELIVVSLTAAKAKKGGLFSKADKGDKSGGDADPKTALLNHFRAGKSVKDAPAGEKKSYTADQVAGLRISQPSASVTESLFAGIPVFGAGRIAVQLPHLEGTEPLQFLSFTLSEFREFAEIIGSVYAMAEFGHNAGIPLVDSFTEHKCHTSNAKVRALEYVSFYEADPAIELKLAGWLCTGCGIVLSEDARAEQKFGGKVAKGIAKAKCPKCEQKFGSNPLYTLAATSDSAAKTDDESDEPAEE